MKTIFICFTTSILLLSLSQVFANETICQQQTIDKDNYWCMTIKGENKQCSNCDTTITNCTWTTQTDKPDEKNKSSTTITTGTYSCCNCIHGASVSITCSTDYPCLKIS